MLCACFRSLICLVSSTLFFVSKAYFGDSSIDDAFLLEDDDGNQYLDYLEFKRLIREKVRIQISDAEFLNLMNIYDENAVRHEKSLQNVSN